MYCLADAVINWNNQIVDLLGKICIPLIIGWITFVIAKRNIINTGVTQFRQQWIDNLRNSISVFIAKAEVISLMDFEEDEPYTEQFEELCQMQYKIELLLNPLEDNHNEIISLLESIREIIHDEKISDARMDKELSRNIDDLLDITKTVLKEEWNIVKKGK
jgi:hypothetical protein